MRRSALSLSVVAGLSLAAGTSAFMTPVPGHGVSLRATTSVAAMRVRAGFTGGVSHRPQTWRAFDRQGATVLSMDTERTAADLHCVKAEGQWRELMAVAAESRSTLMVFFKKDFCRKCAAMKPKFAKLSREFEDRDVMWAEVDGVKIGKDLRTELKLSKVPSFQIWSQGRVVEQFEADINLSITVEKLRTLLRACAGKGENIDMSDSRLIQDLALASKDTQNVHALGSSTIERTGTHRIGDGAWDIRSITLD